MVLTAKVSAGDGVVLYARVLDLNNSFLYVTFTGDAVEIHAFWSSGPDQHFRIPMDQSITTWATKPFVLGIHMTDKEQAVNQTSLDLGIDRDIASAFASNSRLAAWWCRESHPPRWRVGASSERYSERQGFLA